MSANVLGSLSASILESVIISESPLKGTVSRDGFDH
jgi:hypothetical protein